MATYKEIHGTKVQVIAGDPPAPVEGQLWYNSSTYRMKFAKVSTTGAWATGGNLNTARSFIGSAIGGTQNASLGFAGASPPTSAVTESYNGSSWTEVNDLNTSKEALAGAGNQTAALAFGGNADPSPNPQVDTESWNGSSWTEVNNMSTGRRFLAGAGTQTAALAFAGAGAPANPNYLDVTESWNGTSWTEVNDLNTSRQRPAGIGTSNTQALCVAGFKVPGTVPSGKEALTESWNGSSWTEVADLNSARHDPGGSGTYTAGLVFGGDVIAPGVGGVTESWNGSSWTEVADLSTARSGVGGSGTNTLALAFAGATPSITAATEEFSLPATIIETITDE